MTIARHVEQWGLKNFRYAHLIQMLAVLVRIGLYLQFLDMLSASDSFLEMKF